MAQHQPEALLPKALDCVDVVCAERDDFRVCFSLSQQQGKNLNSAKQYVYVCVPPQWYTHFPFLKPFDMAPALKSHHGLCFEGFEYFMEATH